MNAFYKIVMTLVKNIFTLIFLSFNSVSLSQNYGSWTEIDSMNIARVGHAMVVLPNGDVLVCGNDVDSIHSSCEIYDFSTGKWRYTAPMNVPRTLHSVVLLSSGKVLAIGGLFERSCEIFDPQTETWTLSDSMIVARNWGGFTTTSLQDNRILLVGGLSQDSIGAPFKVLNNCEIFDPSTEKWTTVSPMNLGRWLHSATLLSDERVLVTGGETDNLTTELCEIYDPTTNIWTNVGSLNEKRSSHASLLLRNGNVFVSGGSNNAPTLITCEIYNVNTNQWSYSGDMLVYRVNHKIYYLTNVDKLIIVGGGTISFGEDTWEIYDPNLLQPDYYELFPIKQLLDFNNLQLQNENIFVAGGWEYFYNPMPVFYPSYRSWIFDLTAGVSEENDLLKSFELNQNYPNPFNPTTKIKFYLPERSFVKLTVFDLLGNELETLLNEEKDAGKYEVVFEGSGLPSGVYFYKVQTANFNQTKKMVLLK